MTQAAPVATANPTSPAAFPSFTLISSEEIPALGVSIAEYQHIKTGASHYHIASDNPENVFLVALRTVPKDSSGVAHILEHTALCGSEKYPVRDPFFMMIRRSLNSFMNAFTSSDWTAYPFASSNRKDFENLLQVYMDAVFFSRLHPLDFAQEGHRLEFKEAGNPDSELEYKGVVFNEMKGAMSSISSQLWHTLCKYLFPSTTYHYNSGGEPEDIPDLSYDQLKSFYESHYHPSNAIFMTFGDIPAAEHQARFEELALARFEAIDSHIAVGNEKRYHAPIRVQESYPLPAAENKGDKTHIVVSWLLGKSTQLETLLEAQLLAGVLLDNSASPLLHALETSTLGSSPSPMCGLEDSMREMVFACGLEGSSAAKVEEVEALVLDTLRDVAKNGIAKEDVDAVLHQLELQQREIGGDGYPYGLQLILTALGSATHRGKPIELLNLDPALQALRERAAKPDYIKQLAQSLIDNPHRVTLVMSPDENIQQRIEQAEKQRLADIKANLSAEEKQAIIDQASALIERQALEEDDSILPKVTLADVPLDMPALHSEQAQFGSLPYTRYGRGTNGLVYQQLLIALPDLDDEELSLLSIYTQVLTELGLGDQDYLQVQARQAQVCGGISAYTSMRGDINDEQQLKAYLVLSSKALLRNASAQAQLMRDTLETLRFDESDRVQDLVAQLKARRESSITGNGHSLAMTAASAGMSPIAKISEALGGLSGIRQLKSLSERIDAPAELSKLMSQLAAIHSKMLKAERQLLIIAEADRLAASCDEIAPLWHDFNAQAKSNFSYPAVREVKKAFWVANSQVNFCAKAYPTVPSDHPDAPILTVLATYMKNGFLHRVIREQGGAYGGGASQDSNIAAFRFYSYRDPRLKDTLADFDKSIDWMLNTAVSDQGLEEAVLGVVSSIDKPGSPAGEAKQDHHSNVFGRTLAQRRLFRQRVLAVTATDLQRVCDCYLNKGGASVAVLSNAAKAAELSDWLVAEHFSIEQL
ncbi:peptidase M16 inactive domain family protein [gamma proteobacterium BDW918]|uniref:Peptidase M16 n=1 Tax=Zhongshania aliphaticivorans TaxID=1470434 RepID=A0A127M4M2_9GAMM|nr:insulinase family protein [Zhongshania aliphaticivorans]AMO68168.1 peptidase M16 [Zhongshania aliphaticivorans]EIF44279.1 peptidase M16 inactive domain family protein [gamma proteobacterium BDW918]